MQHRQMGTEPLLQRRCTPKRNGLTFRKIGCYVNMVEHDDVAFSPMSHLSSHNRRRPRSIEQHQSHTLRRLTCIKARKARRAQLDVRCDGGK
jgi:hypothetical protein